MWESVQLPDIPDRLQHLFIVRIWQEPGQRAPAEWRGSVEHITSGQRLYFRSLGDLSDFITWRLDSGPAAAGDRQ